MPLFFIKVLIPLMLPKLAALLNVMLTTSSIHHLRALLKIKIRKNVQIKFETRTFTNYHSLNLIKGT